MPYSYAVYTGNGTNDQFTVSFPYIRKEHVFASVNYANATYTWVNDSTIQLNSVPTNGARVEVRRVTPVTNPLVDFTDGSTLVAADLDVNALQQTYINQEQDDQIRLGIYVDANGNLTAGGQRIQNVANPTSAQDAATKNYVDTNDALKVSKAGDSMTGPLAMGTNKITGLGDPTNAQDAATKSWVETSTSAPLVQFRSIFYGAFVTDPAADPYGNAPTEGDLYFNNTLDQMRVFNGASWQEASADATITRFKFTAVGGETSLSGTDDSAEVLTYNVGLELVYLNGVLLTRGVDYTATNGSSITGLVALAAADLVEVVAFSQINAVGSIPGANIADGTITDAKVANGAGIAAAKLAFTQIGSPSAVRTVQAKLQEVDDPEVIDFNKAPLYQLASSYLQTNTTWAFAHTGQSLAEGGVGGDSVNGLIPYPAEVLMLTSGPVGLNTGALGASLTTLSEKARVTIASSYMRNTRTFVSGASNEVVFHGQAWGGQNYASLKKGGSSGVYEKVITQAQAVKASRPNAIYKAVSVIHGEQDGLDNNTNYAANLNEWRTNFNTDLKAVTGQTAGIPLLLCQVGSSSGYNKIGGITSTDFPSQLEQLKAHKTYADIYLVCPKYQLAYYDHSHITNNAQRVLGEYYAKAFERIVETGSWEPLRPSSITGSGNQVVISFVGRVGNLVFDTTAVQAASNQGFAYNDGAGNTITNVQIVSNQVVITLSGTIGANPVVAYAYNNGAGGAANQVAGLGARGNLRDSDTAVSSFNGAPLYNWCVIFKETVA